MKKLLLKIFGMMILSMALVYGISELARFLILKNGNINPDSMYYVSLLSGLCGLVLFAVLLNFFLIRRLKRLSSAVKEVAQGNYDINLVDGGFDEIQTLVNDFNGMTKELKSNEYLSRDFIRNVSHELKTPLSSIMGYAELVNKCGTTETEKNEYAKIIYGEAKRLYEISKQMLEISRLDTASVICRDDVFYADEQIRNIILGLQKDWTEKNIDMKIEMPATEWKGNEELTYHIWQNLISNAIKFAEENGTIDISLKKTGAVLYFEIMNTGKGIAEQNQPFIFNQFYTAESAAAKGTGLGLSIAKKITEKLNGTIRFKSGANAPTIFYVELHENF